ncbi:uncharacterized protein [Dermacentor albipictus]|uniref:uncharacterized protein n=1 Tax=Dermacentor albipictus TaxID=60249 RepID=UPI0038FC8131
MDKTQKARIKDSSPSIYVTPPTNVVAETQKQPLSSQREARSAAPTSKKSSGGIEAVPRPVCDPPKLGSQDTLVPAQAAGPSPKPNPQPQPFMVVRPAGGSAVADTSPDSSGSARGSDIATFFCTLVYLFVMLVAVFVLVYHLLSNSRHQAGLSDSTTSSLSTRGRADIELPTTFTVIATKSSPRGRHVHRVNHSMKFDDYAGRRKHATTATPWPTATQNDSAPGEEDQTTAIARDHPVGRQRRLYGIISTIAGTPSEGNYELKSLFRTSNHHT